VLAQVLDDAHARALRAREEEAARRSALEAHLDDVAHDLRTPLTALHLHLEAATADAPPAQRARLEAALGDVTYLTQLTGNLRADAALRAPADDVRSDLSGIVARVVARFEVIGHHAGVEVAGVVPDAPVLVRADPALTEQAIANLLHNAVRHNRPGGHVSAWLQSTPDGFRLEVADDGPGVPPDRLATLGDPGIGRARRQLGLPITRAVCQRAGWTIRFGALEPSGLQAVVEGPILADGAPIHGSSTPAP
jgi:signal transduction histidine kinase